MPRKSWHEIVYKKTEHKSIRFGILNHQGFKNLDGL